MAEQLARGARAADGRWLIDQAGIDAFQGTEEDARLRLMLVTWHEEREGGDAPLHEEKEEQDDDEAAAQNSVMREPRQVPPPPVPTFAEGRFVAVRVRYYSRANMKPVDGSLASESTQIEEQEANLTKAINSNAVVRKQFRTHYDRCAGQERASDMAFFSYAGDLHRHRGLPVIFQDAGGRLHHAMLSVRTDGRLPWRHTAPPRRPGPFLTLLHRSYFLARYADAALASFSARSGEIVCSNAACKELFGCVIPFAEQVEDLGDDYNNKHPSRRIAHLPRDHLRRFFVASKEVRVASTGNPCPGEAPLSGLPGLAGRCRVTPEHAHTCIVERDHFEASILMDLQCFRLWRDDGIDDDDTGVTHSAMLRGDRWRWFKVTTRRGTDPSNGDATIYVTLQDIHKEESAVAAAEKAQKKAKKLRDDLLYELLPPPVARELLEEMRREREHLPTAQRRWNLFGSISTSSSASAASGDEDTARLTTPKEHLQPEGETSLDSARIGRVTARGHTDVAIVFSDIVGYTALTANLNDSRETMRMLDQLYEGFDEVSDRYSMVRFFPTLQPWPPSCFEVFILLGKRCSLGRETDNYTTSTHARVV